MTTLPVTTARLESATRAQVRAHKRRRARVFALLMALCAAAFLLSLTFGSVSIPVRDVLAALTGQATERASWTVIVVDYRLPKALTALLAGAALGVSGLMMQTLFRNPLADGYVMGVSSGASLGVALVVLGGGVGSTTLLSGLSLAGDVGVVTAAATGAALVMALIFVLSRRLRHVTALLIVGLMLGYAVSAIVSLLAHFTIPERLQAYTNWTFGSFGDTTNGQLVLFALVVAAGMGLALVSAKPLNGLLMGEDTARGLGIRVRRTRVLVMLGAALLAGAVTAFCGPVGFLGIAVPHICRTLLKTSDHLILFPASALLGGILAVSADIIAQAPGLDIVLPLNAVLALFGAPVVLWIVLRRGSLMRGSML
ncbi:MAG: iron ABC transporter permease [Pleurocapsa minor GSE-CHR-MK-17-07R]|jgi:iron complex transport system permease protein|nr:iron ABC transporter permease [Pleurocapsa minor GSE-CHR-MK 17-07R]